MRRERLLPVLILIVILITACGGQTTLPDEPYSPVEYSLYPCPEGAYVGDTLPYVTELWNCIICMTLTITVSAITRFINIRQKIYAPILTMEWH